jgi:hypothetical protein
MALIFAARDTVNEVSIFFHDRLLRACRSTKVNTHKLMAFDSPNLDPLATIGITIDENDHLHLPPPRGALRVHTTMDTRILTIRLVPGFDDGMIRYLIEAQSEKNNLQALILQLYGTGNIPSVKKSFINLLADAADKGILVVATTQCQSGGVMLGHYATGQALVSAGVVSASDMTLEAAACKLAYLCGRGDLNRNEVANLMGFPLRGEGTSHKLGCETGLSCWTVCMARFAVVPHVLCAHSNLVVTRLQDLPYHRHWRVRMRESCEKGQIHLLSHLHVHHSLSQHVYFPLVFCSHTSRRPTPTATGECLRARGEKGQILVLVEWKREETNNYQVM